ATGPRRAELVGSPRGQKWEPWEGSQTLPRRGPAEQSSSVPHAGKNGNRGRVPKPSRDGARRAELVGSPRGQKGNPGRAPKPSRDGAPPGRARRFPTRAKW